MKTRRESKLQRSIILNYGLRAINILINLAFVPLYISYLGKEKYGVWLTIFAFISWLQMFDLGLGNGLKIKLTEAFSKKKVHEINTLISTAYFVIGGVVVALIIFFLVINNFLSLEIIVGLSHTFNLEFNHALEIIILSFLIILVVKLIGVIYASLQLPYVDNLIKTAGQVVFFLLVFGYSRAHFAPSLVNISLTSVLPLMTIYLGITIYIFIIKAPNLLPRISKFSMDALKGITVPGLSFFIIQISMVILYSTDNLIIIKLLSPDAVTNYNVTYKYFSLPFILYTLYISTHWPAFIDALAKKDNSWIKKKINFFNLLFILLFISYIFMFYLYNKLVALWIGENNVILDNRLNLFMMIYFLISSYATIYTYVINASGKLRIQMLAYVIIAIINIPMSIILVKQFNVGSAGVILASAICLLLLLILIPVQYNKLIKNKAYGLWGK